MGDTLYPDSRPWTRWWWFSGEIRREDVCFQLDWMRDHGFGGAEVAFLYPLPGGRPGPAWLSPEWSSIVAYAKREANARGLGLDFTFGSRWPFGGSMVEERDASQTFDGPLDQRLTRSWEEPVAGPILNHLDRGALERYAARMGSALSEALSGRPSGLFCDSWEVPVERLWTAGFGEAFRERFGYELEPFLRAESDRGGVPGARGGPDAHPEVRAEPIQGVAPGCGNLDANPEVPAEPIQGVAPDCGNLDANPEVRYDYRRLVSDFVLEQFYVPYGEACRRLGGFSRVQCHGAPTDLLAAYAAADVPESEAILFDPHFAQFAASAAALSGKAVVSAETFTCLYGWIPYPGPGPYQGQEQIADLKLLADAVLANGVNFILWHGMPYNPPGGGNRFYATVEVGPGAALASDLPAFNAYLDRACAALRRGTTLSRLAVYLPLEDNRMRHRLPDHLRRPSAEYWWELQYQRFPEDASPYRPLWITAPFLEKADVQDGRLWIGNASFPALLLDVGWLEAASLAEILRLARRGLPVCLRRAPSEPGRRKSESFERDLVSLLSQATVGQSLDRVCPAPPLVSGINLPEYFARQDGDDTLFFFAHPKSREISYPMEYGQSLCREDEIRRVRLQLSGRPVELDLCFQPYQSLLVTVGRRNGVKVEDLGYAPPEPSTDSGR